MPTQFVVVALERAKNAAALPTVDGFAFVGHDAMPAWYHAVVVFLCLAAFFARSSATTTN
ncbi:MAG: hypothetical protein AAFP69_07590, partial [Planctomycetota bacterium]